MNIRKLLDWRKLLIYSHRWLAIGITVMFLVWTLSGVILMYYSHPQITMGERLLRLERIDFSTAKVTPAEAAAKAGIGTEYYISEKSNEIVQKTDRRSRILAVSGYVLHNLFFFRQRPWWTSMLDMLDWIAWTAMLMALTGIVVGIWRVALKPRFCHKGILSYTPYSGWMKWHHYAGLIFGFFSISWILSGMIPITLSLFPAGRRWQSA